MNHNLAFIALLLVLAPYATSARQFVEIERRPNNNHELAGTFSFVFGLIGTFASLIVAVAFGFAYLRNSSVFSATIGKESPVELSLPSISTSIREPLSMKQWKLLK